MRFNHYDLIESSPPSKQSNYVHGNVLICFIIVLESISQEPDNNNFRFQHSIQGLYLIQNSSPPTSSNFSIFHDLSLQYPYQYLDHCIWNEQVLHNHNHTMWAVDRHPNSWQKEHSSARWTTIRIHTAGWIIWSRINHILWRRRSSSVHYYRGRLRLKHWSCSGVIIVTDLWLSLSNISSLDPLRLRLRRIAAAISPPPLPDSSIASTPP